VPPPSPASSARRILHPASYNPDHPLNQKRVGWWLGWAPMSGGKRWYDICRGQVGTVNGNLAWEYTPRGDAGPKLSGSTTDYTSLGTPPALEVYSPVTIAVWAKPTTVSGLGFMVAKDTHTGNRCYALGRTGANWYLERNGAAAITTTGSGAVVGQWSRVYLTHDGTTWTIRAYTPGVAGVITGTATSGSSFTNSASPWEIGRRNYASAESPFTGTLTDVGMWSRCLSASELAADYAESIAGYPTMLRWRRPDILVPLVATAAAGNRRRRALICGGPR
jgi:hypothetical protein